MTDREKIIVHFRDAIEASGCNNKWRFVRVDILEEAIAMLKEEQEGVEPVKEHEVVMNTLVCGVCHTLVARWGVDWHGDRTNYFFKAKYCPECGRKVKWDE